MVGARVQGAQVRPLRNGFREGRGGREGEREKERDREAHPCAATGNLRPNTAPATPRQAGSNWAQLSNTAFRQAPPYQPHTSAPAVTDRGTQQQQQCVRKGSTLQYLLVPPPHKPHGL